MLKKLSFIFVIALLLGGSAMAFAWWDNLEATESGQELEIGQGVRLTVADQTTSGQGLLVPAGSFYASGADYTTTYEFTYDLSLEEGALAEGFDADLIVTLENLALDGGAFADTLFTLDINGEEVKDPGFTHTFTAVFDDETHTYQVVLQIALKDHPDSSLDSSDYEAVAGKDLTFDISFEIE